MIKGTVLLSLALASTTAFSETLKLACSFSQQNTYHATGKVENNKGRIVLQIDINGGLTLITGTTMGLNVNLASRPAGKVKEAKDRSDFGKLDISNKITDDEPSMTEIIIDRNTGDFYYRLFSDDKYKTEIEASGTCDKIEMSKRKF